MRITVTEEAPGEGQRPRLLGHAGQSGQCLVGVVYGLSLGQAAEVVRQLSLVDLDHGTFALDNDGIHGNGTLAQRYVTQVRTVGFHGAELVCQVLYLQHVGPQRRVDLEPSVTIRFHGVDKG